MGLSDQSKFNLHQEKAYYVTVGCKWKLLPQREVRKLMELYLWCKSLAMKKEANNGAEITDDSPHQQNTLNYIQHSPPCWKSWAFCKKSKVLNIFEILKFFKQAFTTDQSSFGQMRPNHIAVRLDSNVMKKINQILHCELNSTNLN